MDAVLMYTGTIGVYIHGTVRLDLPGWKRTQSWKFRATRRLERDCCGLNASNVAIRLAPDRRIGGG